MLVHFGYSKLSSTYTRIFTAQVIFKCNKWSLGSRSDQLIIYKKYVDLNQFVISKLESSKKILFLNCCILAFRPQYPSLRVRERESCKDLEFDTFNGYYTII